MMMRRMLFFLMIILIGSALHALDLHVDEIQPSRITLSWDRVPSALTYDLYLNGRYRATVRTPSYRQYEVTSQFANRGFTLHTGNKKINPCAATACKWRSL